MEASKSAEVKRYLARLFSACDPGLAAKERAKGLGLPNIHITDTMGKFLSLLVRLARPMRILEIGAFSGYSALWLARHLPEGGKILTIEKNSLHAACARENIAQAGRDQAIEIIEGDATEILEDMIAKCQPSFDLAFIDGDKKEYLGYLELILKLSRPGTLILSDNLIPKRGKLGRPLKSDPTALELHAFNQMLASDPRLDSIILPSLVKESGRIDGLGLSLVL